MTAPAPDTFRFGDFTLDTRNRVLSRGGKPLELGNRYFNALVLMVRADGQLVRKDDFMQAVWRGIPVTDEALTQCIRTLRRALEDDAAAPRFIATVPKHGYRFVAPVETGLGAAPPPVARAVHSLPSAVAAACTIAGLLSGLVAGAFYAVVSGGPVIVLAALVAALGLLGGGGVGAGLSAALAWRGRADVWLVAGGAAGGMAVGALGSMVSREGVGLLTARDLPPVTGLVEGIVLGAATGSAVWLALSGRPARLAIPVAATIGMGAGLLLHLAGGVLLGGSLWALQQGLPDIRFDLQALGRFMGDAPFGPRAQRLTALAEAGAFTASLALAAILARSRADQAHEKGRPPFGDRPSS
ncbi:winged helix-turn-helix domain-containing protein [Paraurantiacibacter namhicola]|uniref:Transcriptional activator CadC n=1 Tax=Paraurantiacibacter namhicola TaxID=645517 RepID=A0A1C7DBZ1_9SPHN|nr:transcriptional regulator [Paraurantiacibacter namhicola]ANU08831.1 Transcriptional activator CadC [Paraurantiacibacter namhicola]